MNFQVPFGRALVPYLVDFTADISTLQLQWSGVTVYRTHTLINIPGGWFQVARACSGVSFLMTALVLGLLYAELNFTSWRKRVVAVLLAMAIAVVANALRVYITIGVSHLTNIEFGPGGEHITFGRFFFIGIMLATFWVGRRWHDEDPGMPAWVRALAPAPPTVRPALWAAPVVALVALLAAPPYQAMFQRQLAQEASAAAGTLVSLPAAREAWSGPAADPSAWRPQYHDALSEAGGSYRDASGGRVDAWVGVYGIGLTGGAEMISYANVLYPEEQAVVPEVAMQHLDLAGRTLEVKELRVPDGGAGQLVWHWYVVGDRVATSPYVVKALEGATWLTHHARTERVVTLATRYDEGAHARLEAFVHSHAACVASSFAAEACGD
jgi:EpsI family protein